MTDEVGSAIIAGIAGLAGAGLAIAGALVSETFRRKSDRRGVASAFAGEIAGVIHGADVRGTAEGFKRIAEALNSGVTIRRPWAWYDEKADQKPIFDAYIARVGELGGTVPERIAKFYTVMNIIASDTRRLVGPEFEFNQPAAATLIFQDINLWGAARRDALLLVEDLQRIAADGV